MEYKRIVAVTGLPGLYEVLSSKSDGAIVRSLDDKSTKFISSRIHNLSHLESIEVYTSRENVALSELFIAMKDNKEALPDLKDNQSIKTYFEKVYPDLDFERVYTSDMKKMVKWYEVLKNNDIDFTVSSEEEEEETETETERETEAPAAKKTKAKAKATAEKDDSDKAEEKPKKPRKKKED